MNETKILGSRKVLIASVAMCLATISAFFGIESEAFYLSIVGIVTTFFGANAMEHKHAKEAVLQGKKLGEEIKKSQERLENEKD